MQFPPFWYWDMTAPAVILQRQTMTFPSRKIFPYFIFQPRSRPTLSRKKSVGFYPENTAGKRILGLPTGSKSMNRDKWQKKILRFMIDSSIRSTAAARDRSVQLKRQQSKRSEHPIPAWNKELRPSQRIPAESGRNLRRI